MPREGVPKRILKLRRVGAIADWWSVAPAVFADGRRTLRKWLADPQVSEDLKAGDAALLARFEAHHAERRRPKFHLLTQDEMEALHTRRRSSTWSPSSSRERMLSPRQIDAMQDADGTDAALTRRRPGPAAGRTGYAVRRGLRPVPVVVGRLPEVGLVVEDHFDEGREAEGKAEFDLRFPREALGDPADRVAKAAGGSGDG